jgi:hypothetical protein
MIIPIRFGIAQTVYFPLIVAGGTAFQTAWSPATGESRYIGDGAAASNLGSNPVHQDDGIWEQSLTVAESSFGTTVLTYQDGETDIEDQAIVLSTIFSGQIEANLGVWICEVDSATFTPTAAIFEAFKLAPDITEPTVADRLKGRNVMFTTGVLTGEMSDITGYVLANGKLKLTVTGMTAAPADTDRFVLL